MAKAKIYGMKRKCIPNRDADRLCGKATARGCGKPAASMKKLLRHLEESNA